MNASRYRWNLHVVAAAVFVSIAAASCAACQTPTPPPPAPLLFDASAAEGGGWDVYSQACIRLDQLGRPEAHPEAGTCYDALRHGQESHLSNYAPGCVADAGSVADLCRCSRAWAQSKGCAGR